MRNKRPTSEWCLLLALILMLYGFILPARAVENIRQHIDQKNQEIQLLETEAQKYRIAIEGKEREAENLQTRIQSLDRAINRLAANIRLTNAKMSRTNLEITELAEDMTTKELAISRQRSRLAHLILAQAASDSESPLEIMMKHETVSLFFNAVDQLLGIQNELQSLLGNLREDREELKQKKAAAEKKKLELAALADDLTDQKALQEYERRERSTLLQETRNQERRYQELLADVERKRDALQQEINTLEAGLDTAFDVSQLPRASSGILGWPLPNPIFITQYFGNTPFAKSGAYRGKGHNGIDLRAPAGTLVFASEQGIVRATGNTDLACRRASYGQWVLIDHPNNLSTLLTHLSLIKVRPGDAVNRGEVIGYSGRSGYATGPHLHFTVFARHAVAVGQLRSRICGRTMTLPLSPFGGYLNPLVYL